MLRYSIYAPDNMCCFDLYCDVCGMPTSYIPDLKEKTAWMDESELHIFDTIIHLSDYDGSGTYQAQVPKAILKQIKQAYPEDIYIYENGRLDIAIIMESRENKEDVKLIHSKCKGPQAETTRAIHKPWVDEDAWEHQFYAEDFMPDGEFYEFAWLMDEPGLKAEKPAKAEKKKAPKAEKPAKVEKPGLDKMTVAELKEVCKVLGITPGTKKEYTINRIKAFVCGEL